MANNEEFLRRGLSVMSDEAAPFVERSMLDSYGEDWERIVLNDRAFEGRPLAKNDPMVWLKVMREYWKGTFDTLLKPYHLHTIRELLSLRNMYSHHEPLDDEDILRGLDNIRVLLVGMQGVRLDRIDLLIDQFRRTFEDVADDTRARPASGAQPDPGPVGVPPEIDGLIFEEERSRSGRLIKAYRPGWHWNRRGGDYRKGRDFFWLEYEVHEPSREVLVQVESPKLSVDPGLNGLKTELVGRIKELAKLDEGGVRCRLGPRVDRLSAESTKCTSVLNVSFGNAKVTTSDWSAAARYALSSADRILGRRLGEEWNSVVPRLPR